MSLTPYYSDSAVTLYLGDCREILPQLEAVDHVITDPPYDDVTHSRGGKAVRRYDGGPDIPVIPFAPLEDMDALALEMARLTKRWALVFCAVRQIHLWTASLEANGLRVPRVMIWVKPDASPQFSGDRPGHGYEPIVVANAKGKTRWNGGGHRGVLQHMRIDRASGWHHPTQKPELLMRELVTLFTDEGETILDPFGGSGTTAVAAKRLGRKCILIERDERYAESAASRLSQSALELWEVGTEAGAVDPQVGSTPSRPRADRSDLFSDRTPA